MRNAKKINRKEYFERSVKLLIVFKLYSSRNSPTVVLLSFHASLQLNALLEHAVRTHSILYLSLCNSRNSPTVVLLSFHTSLQRNALLEHAVPTHSTLHLSLCNSKKSPTVVLLSFYTSLPLNLFRSTRYPPTPPFTYPFVIVKNLVK